MKAYEQSQRSHKHYKRILSAKPSVPSVPAVTIQPPPSTTPNRRYSSASNSCTKYQSVKSNRPMQMYQYVNNNHKLAHKLRQIYEGNGTVYQTFHNEKQQNIKSSKKRGRRTLKNAGVVRQKQNFIQQENKRIVGRILTIKSTVQDYIEKGNKNRGYSLLTSKSRKNSITYERGCREFEIFRKELMRDAKGRSKSGSKKSRRRRRRNLVIQSVLNEKSFQQII